MVKAAGSGRGQRGLALSAAHHVRARAARWSSSFLELRCSVSDEVCCYGRNRRRAATELGNGEAAQPVLGDGEGGLR
jgi:hypothetical protein